MYFSDLRQIKDVYNSQSTCRLKVLEFGTDGGVGAAIYKTSNISVVSVTMATTCSEWLSRTYHAIDMDIDYSHKDPYHRQQL